MRAELTERSGASAGDRAGDRAGNRAGAGHPRRALRAARWPAKLRYLQVLPVAVVLWALDAVARFRAGAQGAGLRHAGVVAEISVQFGGGVVRPMNHWLAAHAALAGVAAFYYIVLHGLVAGVVGLLLLGRRPGAFGFHRNALIAVNVIGLAVFWLYPVAPPRMLAGYHDVAATAVPLFSSVVMGQAASQFASLPSLHVAWAVWAAVVAGTLLRRRALQVLVWLYPAATIADVLATANHYVLDVLTAPGVLLLAYLMAAALARARLGARRRPGAAPAGLAVPGDAGERAAAGAGAARRTAGASTVRSAPRSLGPAASLSSTGACRGTRSRASPGGRHCPAEWRRSRAARRSPLEDDPIAERPGRRRRRRRPRWRPGPVIWYSGAIARRRSCRRRSAHDVVR
jgi:PAP2 superfamily